MNYIEAIGKAIFLLYRIATYLSKQFSPIALLIGAVVMPRRGSIKHSTTRY